VALELRASELDLGWIDDDADREVRGRVATLERGRDGWYAHVCSSLHTCTDDMERRSGSAMCKSCVSGPLVPASAYMAVMTETAFDADRHISANRSQYSSMRVRAVNSMSTSMLIPRFSPPNDI
jgi:hypothetical protein